MRSPLILASILAIGSCHEAEATTIDESMVVMSYSGPNSISDYVPGPIPFHPRGPSVAPEGPTVLANPWVEAPFVCETFDVYENVGRVRLKAGGFTYPSRYKRNRYRHKLLTVDKQRTYALVRMVADEMDFEPLLPEIHASHEVSGKYEAIHILNNDRSANKKAWEKFSYSETKEKKLMDEMASLSPQGGKYWRVRDALRYVQMYKGNKHWNTYLKYTRHIPERVGTGGEVIEGDGYDESRSVWWFGYGLYGMNAVLYTQVWDNQAPPWIMCSHEGIIATISYVWVARDASYKCEELSRKDPEKYGTDGGSNKGVLRRMAKGQCGKGRLGPKWQGMMKSFEGRGIDWDAPAKVGAKWPQFEMYSNGKPRRDDAGNRIPTDRKKVLDHMVAKAERLGLLREEPLERPEGTAPRMVRMRGRG